MLTLAATLSLDEAAHTLWDAIVIGAGSAGTIAARELARRGAAVLLLERSIFPRVKVCGGCLNGRALGILESLRLNHVLPIAQAAPVRQFVVQACGRRATIDLPVGVAIKRSSFDLALVEAAIAAGASFLPETTAHVEPDAAAQPDHRTVVLEQQGRQVRQVRGRVILAADGLGHPSVRHIEAFRSRAARGTRVGLGLTASAEANDYPPGAIHMAVARDGYVGLVRTADGQLNVAAAVDPESLRNADAPTELLNRILTDAGMPVLPAIGAHACRGTLPLTRSSGRLAHSRIFLLGDAAGYVEPFTGEGMGWAMSSAVSVVPYVLRSLQTWDPHSAEAWEREQQGRLSKGQRTCRILARSLRHPALVSMALGALGVMPGIAQPFVRRIAAGPASGQARTT